MMIDDVAGCGDRDPRAKYHGHRLFLLDQCTCNLTTCIIVCDFALIIRVSILIRAQDSDTKKLVFGIV